MSTKAGGAIVLTQCHTTHVNYIKCFLFGSNPTHRGVLGHLYLYWGIGATLGVMKISGHFTSPRVNVIIGPGFSVEVLGRTGLRYTEGDKVMLIYSEALTSPGHMVLYQSSMIRWKHPSALEPPGPDERLRIIQNIRQTFEPKGYVLEITRAP
jgi:hypothetical protein